MQSVQPREYCGPVFQTRHCLLICGSCVRCSTGTCSGVTAGNCEMMPFGLRGKSICYVGRWRLERNDFRIAVICLRDAVAVDDERGDPEAYRGNRRREVRTRRKETARPRGAQILVLFAGGPDCRLG